MSQDDPFSSLDSDRTVIIPSPGGRTPSPSQFTQNSDISVSPSSVSPSGLNPTLAAANPLLNIVQQIRSTLQHADPSGLRDFIAQKIKEFELDAKAAGVSPEKVIGARYALCTLIDEAAAGTPWGSGIWAKHSLLVMFHNEAWGGEKFFQLLARLAENPKANRDLLEFMYVCLTLGFQGRYQVVENGRAHLETLRERLASLLDKERGDYERELSPHWQAAVIKRSRLLTLMPGWVLAALCGLVMLTAYLTFSFLLNRDSDPMFAQIQSIRVRNPLPEPKPLPAPVPRLAQFLSAEIREGLVAVRDEEGQSVVTIKGDELFAPGSATIRSKFIPLLTRISAALNSVPGQVKVTGHTDNQPIRSIRFPSNWHLSKERAASVMQILEANGVLVSRMSAEGLGDVEPIAPNDTPEGRARNRRVEITLYVPKSQR
jgi:type VI secretion system protein ImpK